MKLIALLTIIIAQIIFITSNDDDELYMSPTCDEAELNYNECMIEYFETVKTKFINGIPEINFPNLNPFQIERYTLSNIINAESNFEGLFSNIEATGFEEIKLTEFNFDRDNLKTNLILAVSTITVTFGYNINAIQHARSLNILGTAELEAKDLNYKVFLNLNGADTESREITLANQWLSIRDVDLRITPEDPDWQDDIDAFLALYQTNRRGMVKTIEALANTAFSTVAEDALKSIINKEPIVIRQDLFGIQN